MLRIKVLPILLATTIFVVSASESEEPNYNETEKKSDSEDTAYIMDPFKSSIQKSGSHPNNINSKWKNYNFKPKDTNKPKNPTTNPKCHSPVMSTVKLVPVFGPAKWEIDRFDKNPAPTDAPQPYQYNGVSQKKISNFQNPVFFNFPLLDDEESDVPTKGPFPTYGPPPPNAKIDNLLGKRTSRKPKFSNVKLTPEVGPSKWEIKQFYKYPIPNLDNKNPVDTYGIIKGTSSGSNQPIYYNFPILHEKEPYGPVKEDSKKYASFKNLPQRAEYGLPKISNLEDDRSVGTDSPSELSLENNLPEVVEFFEKSPTSQGSSDDLENTFAYDVSIIPDQTLAESQPKIEAHKRNRRALFNAYSKSDTAEDKEDPLSGEDVSDEDDSIRNFECDDHDEFHIHDANEVSSFPEAKPMNTTEPPYVPQSFHGFKAIKLFRKADYPEVPVMGPTDADFVTNMPLLYDETDDSEDLGVMWILRVPLNKLRRSDSSTTTDLPNDIADYNPKIIKYIENDYYSDLPIVGALGDYSDHDKSTINPFESEFRSESSQNSQVASKTEKLEYDIKSSTKRSKRSLLHSPIFSSVFGNSNPSKSLTEKFFEGSSRRHIYPVFNGGNQYSNFDPWFDNRRTVYNIPHQRYGIPNQKVFRPFKEYGLPKAPVPFENYGVPRKPIAKPHDIYGTPFEVYGLPNIDINTPFRKNILLRKPHRFHGIPRNPFNSYELPRNQITNPWKEVLQIKPQDSYGVPTKGLAEPSNKYGLPKIKNSAPFSEYGVPDISFHKYILPKIQITQPFRKYGALELPRSKPQETYGVPTKKPIQPSYEYGLPKIKLSKPFETYVFPTKEPSKSFQKQYLPRINFTNSFVKSTLIKEQITQPFKFYDGGYPEVIKPVEESLVQEEPPPKFFTYSEIPRTFFQSYELSKVRPVRSESSQNSQMASATKKSESDPKSSPKRSKRSLLHSPIFSSVFGNSNPSKSLTEKFFEGSSGSHIYPVFNGGSQYSNVDPWYDNHRTLHNIHHQRYGTPNQNVLRPFNEYGLPNAPVPKPFEEYGVPQKPIAKPHEIYGVPFEEYGPPNIEINKPFRENFLLKKPQRFHGIPSNPFNSYGLPRIQLTNPWKEVLQIKPHDSYGVPIKEFVETSNKYGLPKIKNSAPFREYGVPDNTFHKYVLPKIKITKPFKKYGALELPRSKPQETYGAPTKKPTQPSHEYGLPKINPFEPIEETYVASTKEPSSAFQKQHLPKINFTNYFFKSTLIKEQTAHPSKPYNAGNPEVIKSVLENPVPQESLTFSTYSEIPRNFFQSHELPKVRPVQTFLNYNDPETQYYASLLNAQSEKSKNDPNYEFKRILGTNKPYYVKVDTAQVDPIIPPPKSIVLSSSNVIPVGQSISYSYHVGHTQDKTLPAKLYKMKLPKPKIPELFKKYQAPKIATTIHKVNIAQVDSIIPPPKPMGISTIYENPVGQSFSYSFDVGTGHNNQKNKPTTSEYFPRANSTSNYSNSFLNKLPNYSLSTPFHAVSDTHKTTFSTATTTAAPTNAFVTKATASYSFDFLNKVTQSSQIALIPKTSVSVHLPVNLILPSSKPYRIFNAKDSKSQLPQTLVESEAYNLPKPHFSSTFKSPDQIYTVPHPGVSNIISSTVPEIQKLMSPEKPKPVQIGGAYVPPFQIFNNQYAIPNIPLEKPSTQSFHHQNLPKYFQSNHFQNLDHKTSVSNKNLPSNLPLNLILPTLKSYSSFKAEAHKSESPHKLVSSGAYSLPNRHSASSFKSPDTFYTNPHPGTSDIISSTVPEIQKVLNPEKPKPTQIDGAYVPPFQIPNNQYTLPIIPLEKPPTQSFHHQNLPEYFQSNHFQSLDHKTSVSEKNYLLSPNLPANLILPTLKSYSNFKTDAPKSESPHKLVPSGAYSLPNRHPASSFKSPDTFYTAPHPGVTNIAPAIPELFSPQKPNPIQVGESYVSPLQTSNNQYVIPKTPLEKPSSQNIHIQDLPKSSQSNHFQGLNHETSVPNQKNPSTFNEYVAPRIPLGNPSTQNVQLPNLPKSLRPSNYQNGLPRVLIQNIEYNSQFTKQKNVEHKPSNVHVNTGQDKTLNEGVSPVGTAPSNFSFRDDKEASSYTHSTVSTISPQHYRIQEIPQPHYSSKNFTFIDNHSTSPNVAPQPQKNLVAKALRKVYKPKNVATGYGTPKNISLNQSLNYQKNLGNTNKSVYDENASKTYKQGFSTENTAFIAKFSGEKPVSKVPLKNIVASFLKNRNLTNTQASTDSPKYSENRIGHDSASVNLPKTVVFSLKIPNFSSTNFGIENGNRGDISAEEDGLSDTKPTYRNRTYFVNKSSLSPKTSSFNTSPVLHVKQNITKQYNFSNTSRLSVRNRTSVLKSINSQNSENDHPSYTENKKLIGDILGNLNENVNDNTQNRKVLVKVVKRPTNRKNIVASILEKEREQKALNGSVVYERERS